MPDNGKIVKADDLPRSVPASPDRVVRRDVDAARLRADELIEAAQARAASIVALADQQRSEVLRAAAQKGYEEGLRRWNEILIAAENRAQELVRRYEADLIRLAARMAEKILGERLQTDPGAIIGIVGEALKSVRREKSLTIQVHPDCVDVLRGRLEELKARVGGSKEIWVEGNPAVQPGGCIVESDVGIVDARIETQLRCMEQALLQAAKK